LLRHDGFVKTAPRVKPRDRARWRGFHLPAMKILTCNSNRPLAEAISAYLGLPLAKASVRRFSDMEVFVEIHENVRGEDVFVIQSTSYPANDNLMELLIAVDALQRASARRITAVMPYFGYARQDRKTGGRTPISAKLVANLITRAGADRVLTMDLHAGQIQGFFDIPTDNLVAIPVMARDIKLHYEKSSELMIVSPDVGGVVRARALAKRLESDLAIIDKRRPKANVSEVMNVIGEVSGRTCVIMDDMVDTAGTLVKAAQVLKDEGATKVVAYCTHPVLSGGAVERIAGSPLDELVVTDTIPLRDEARQCKKIRQLSVAGLLAETILRIYTEESVSSLFIE
jgi:ribose-phosphate pyrophosphokinase